MEEMSQEQIRYTNLLGQIFTGEYRNSPFKSLSNIIHWLRAYGVLRYDEVTIGSGEVHFFHKKIATYTFDEERQMPIFEFIKEYYFCQDNQDLFFSCKGKYPNPYERFGPNYVI